MLPPNALIHIPLPIFVENNRNSRKMSWERKEGSQLWGRDGPQIPWDREYPPCVQEKRGPGRWGVTERDPEWQSIWDSGLWKALLLWEKEYTEEWGRTGLGAIGEANRTGQLMALGQHLHWWRNILEKQPECKESFSTTLHADWYPVQAPGGGEAACIRASPLGNHHPNESITAVWALIFWIDRMI